MKLVSEDCRVISKSGKVITKGDRSGQIVYRLGLSDGEGVLNDLQADIPFDVYDSLVCFEKLYKCVFSYEQRTFNGRAYTTFVIEKIIENKVRG